MCGYDLCRRLTFISVGKEKSVCEDQSIPSALVLTMFIFLVIYLKPMCVPNTSSCTSFVILFVPSQVVLVLT